MMRAARTNRWTAMILRKKRNFDDTVDLVLLILVIVMVLVALAVYAFYKYGPV